MLNLCDTLVASSLSVGARMVTIDPLLTDVVLMTGIQLVQNE